MPIAGLRRLLRQSLMLLPRDRRFEAYRRRLRLDLEPPPELTIGIAATREELEAAYRILHDEYVREGYMQPQPSGMRITPYHALPSTTTILAKWNGEPVGTVSIIRDSGFGFPLDKIFDTSRLRRYGARLAEVSALAIARRHQARRGATLFPMMKYVMNYCTRHFGIDHVVIAVNPRHIELYEFLLTFERLPAAPVASYDYVNGAPAVGAYLDLRQAWRRLAAAYAHRPPAQNAFHYFIEADLPCLVFPDRRYFKISDPIMTPELLDHFFNRLSPVFAEMPEAERSRLRFLYNHPAYDRVLPPSSLHTLHRQARATARFDVKCAGRLVLGGSRVVNMTVTEASVTGFRAVLDQPIRFGDPVRMNIAVADFRVADLTGWPVWQDDRTYGFHIESASPGWQEFIEACTREIHQLADRDDLERVS